VDARAVRGVAGSRRQSRTPHSRAAFPPAAAAFLLVAIVIAIGYAHTAGYPPVFDDYDSIVNNAALDRPGDPAALWRFRPSRVVTYLSLALNVAITGRSPAGLRVVNLLLHLACALLVGGIGAHLTRRLSRSGASAAARPPVSPATAGLVAALLFAAHPLATQAVTYLSGRSVVLASFLELSSIALYLRARERGGFASAALSGLCALLAALTKEMTVALPAAIALLELALRRSEPSRERPRAAWPALYLLVLPLVAWAAHLPSAALGRAAEGFRETADIDRATYLLTQFTVVPRYLGLWLGPAGQTLDHDIPLRHAADGGVIAGAAVLAAALAFAWLARRSWPLVAVGIAWFFVHILPESSVFPIRDVMVEHRAYLPMAGLAWAVAALLADRASRAAAGWIAIALIVAALVVTTHVRNRIWRDELALWSDATLKSPGKARAQNNYGLALRAEGRLEEAEAAYRRAIAIEPGYVNARMNLAVVLRREGRPADAIALLRETDALAPGDWRVLNNLGTTLWATGDTTSAADAYARAIAAAPGRREAAENLARMRSPAPVAK
jgi:tetratricopeptide (TPR) repeat protein